MPDLNARELAILAPLVALILWIGMYPKPVLDRMAPAAEQAVKLAQQSRWLPPSQVPVPVRPSGQQQGGVAMNGER